MTTIDQFVGLHSQMNEIVKRVGNGSLDAEQVKDSLQAIIEKRQLLSPSVTSVLAKRLPTPSWYVSPEQQLEGVRWLNAERKWGFSDSDMPSVPQNVTLNKGELLLLCVYLPKAGKQTGLQRTFDELWELCQAPNGYTKYRWDELKSDSKHLRSAPGHSHRVGVRWVIINPTAYHGKSAEYALSRRNEDNIRVAGVEALMLQVLCPDWATSWNGDSSPYPNLSGLQFYWNSDWSGVPYLRRWDDDRRLELRAFWADSGLPYWASPSVREC